MAYNIIAGIGVVTSPFNPTNPCNLQTCDNIVMVCDDVSVSNYTAGDTLIAMSDASMHPAQTLTIPVCVTHGNSTDIVPLTITPSGEVYLDHSYSSAIVHLNGICWHVNSQYYTPAIGNIYNNGSSPLGVR